MFLKNALIYAATRGGAGLLNFLAVVLYSRLLGPEEYGRYALVIATVGIGSAALFQWLRSGARRFLTTHAERRGVFLATLRRGYLVMVGLAALLAVVLIVGVPAKLPPSIVLLGLLILSAQGWYDLSLELLLVDLEPTRYGMVALLRSALGLAVGAALAATGYGPVGVLVGVLTGYVVSPLVLARRVWGRIWHESASPRIQRELLHYGLPLTATFALEYVVSSSDRYLLGLLAGVGEVGRYAVGYDLAYQSITALLMIVNLAAFPLTVRAVEQAEFSVADRQLRIHGTILYLVAAPAVTGLLLLAGNITHVLVGQQFRASAATILPIIGLSAVFAGLKAYYFDLSYQLGRATGVQVWVSGLAALTNVGLNIWWIPSLGATGAALATLVAYASGCGLSLALGSRGRQVPIPWAAWVKVSAASLIMAACLWPLAGLRGAASLGLQVLVGILGFGLSIYLLDVADARTRFRFILQTFRAKVTSQ